MNTAVDAAEVVRAAELLTLAHAPAADAVVEVLDSAGADRHPLRVPAAAIVFAAGIELDDPDEYLRLLAAAGRIHLDHGVRIP